MNYITIENLSLNYGDKIVFENESLYINKDDKIALVAKNGTGKTTLLKLLFQDELPNANSKFYINPDIKVGYLAQDPIIDCNLSIKEYLYQSQSEMFLLIEQFHKESQNENSTIINNLIEKMDRLNAWDVESKLEQILSKLEITNLEQKINTLSGGQKKRVALTQILIEEPDLILMDEPTNHLDPNMIEWLEHYLLKSSLSYFIITHDRYFLDTVCNQILELENGKFDKYNGNYSYYLEKKNIKLEQAKANQSKAMNLYRKELEWMRRQPKARTTKSKSRIDNFDNVEKSAMVKFKSDSIKLETIENRLGSKILEFHNVKKRFEDRIILDNFNYKFKKQDKIGIIGKNGVGKTTFLKMILGNEKVDSGEIILGDTVKIGYYSQEYENFDPEKRLIEVVKDVADFIPLKGGKNFTASQMLERFLFDKNLHYVMISKLSGGERRRLSLILILMQNPNFLILDEPTNDLDIVTLNVLQEFIEEYEGCVIIISHDRYFMDNCMEQLFVFEGEGVVKHFFGTYSEYYMSIKNNISNQKNITPQTTNETKIATPEIDSSKRKLSFNEQRELKMIEKELPILENKKNLLSQKITDNSSYNEIQKISDELTVIIEKIDLYTERWLELEG